jgi:hypothetical protein
VKRQDAERSHPFFRLEAKMQQFTANLVYDLRFIASGSRDVPELVLIVHEPHIALLEEQIGSFLASSGNQLLETGVAFGDSDSAFGYGPCAYRVRDKDCLEYHFLLLTGTASNISRTISIVMGTASALVAKSEADNTSKSIAPNRSQMMTVFAARIPNLGLHSHPIAGWIAPAFRNWLSTLASRIEEKPAPLSYGKPLPPLVREAMVLTWRAVARSRDKQWATDASARISEDGRFILSCFGNACDVAIYPDLDFGAEEGYTVRFDCHNLDTAEQQITLLTGIAALWELAQKEMN